MPFLRWLCVSAISSRVCIAQIVLALTILLLAPPLAAQPSTAQGSTAPPAAVPLNPITADSATQAPESSKAEVKRDSLPREPGFHDIADRFNFVTERRLRSALSRLPQSTTAPRISVVILREPNGNVQDHAQRIFQSCCTDLGASPSSTSADSQADTTDDGHLLLVVYTEVKAVGIAGDDRAFATIPRATVERIVDEEMIADGYIGTTESVHAGLTALLTELGATDKQLVRVSEEGPQKSRAEAIQDTLLVLALFFFVLFIPGVVVTGVVTVMESAGCLRYVLYFLSWVLVTAWTVGTVIGLHELLGEPFGGNAEQYLILPGAVIGFVVYLIINAIMNRWLDDLSTEDYETWKYTLQGGAAVGASAGAVANLVRSAAAKGSSGFGGFGGGGFGGGGAGGSFQAASGGVSAASTSGAASGAVSGVSAASGAVSTASVSGGAVGSAAMLSGLSAKYRWRALRRRLRAFRWYHYITFAVVAYVFYQIAIYALWALQFDPLFWMVAVPVTIYASVRLWDRWGPDIQERVNERFGDDDEDDPDFPGDSAMASW